MPKTSIYLERELDLALQRLAARQGVTKAEAIRRALRAAVSGAPKPRISAMASPRARVTSPTMPTGTCASRVSAPVDRRGCSGIGLTDASLVALAARLGIAAIATFDERHFRAVRPLGRATAFTLLPADAA